MNVDPVIERYGPPARARCLPGSSKRVPGGHGGSGARGLDDGELARRGGGATTTRRGGGALRLLSRARGPRARGAEAAARACGAAGPRHGGQPAVRRSPRSLAGTCTACWRRSTTPTSTPTPAAGSGRCARRSPTRSTSSARIPRSARGGCRVTSAATCRRRCRTRSARAFPTRARRAPDRWARFGAGWMRRWMAPRSAWPVLDESQLATPARWSGYAVDVGFRLGRHVVASPGAHGAGGEDAGHARPRVPRDRSAAAPRAPRLWPARVGGVRRAAVPSPMPAGITCGTPSPRSRTRSTHVRRPARWQRP